MHVHYHLKSINRAAKGKRRRKAIRRAHKRRASGKHIRVELISSAEVERLEARDEALREDLSSIRKDIARIEKVRSEDNYEYMTLIGQIRRKLNL